MNSQRQRKLARIAKLKEEQESAHKKGSSRKFKVKKTSRGKLFKNVHGFSKTMKRNMLKAGVYDPQNTKMSLSKYKEIRKERKKKIQSLQKSKHDKALAHRRANAAGKSKSTGKKTKMAA